MRRFPASANASRGFTLLELMVAVAIVSILVTLAVPSFRTLMINNRGSAHANALVQILTTARSEAIKRNRVVALCKSEDGANCDQALTWDQGILMFTFTDTNASGDYDAGEPIVTVIRADVPFVSQSVITGNASIDDSISYQPTGRGPLTGTFTIVPSGADASQEKEVALYFGRPRASQRAPL